MNTPNPLLPQGTLPPPGRSSLYFKILIVFAFHIVVLGGILMAGCNKDAAKSPQRELLADSTPITPPTGPDPYATTPTQVPLPPAVGGPTAPPVPVPAVPATVGIPTPPVVPPVPVISAIAGSREASDYQIAPGDTLDALHKKFNVSVKALEDANPGIDAKKLQLKQTVHIPAGSTVAATTGTAKASGDTTPATSGDTTTYAIKPGDSLTKIAKAHNTTIKAIQDLNGMKTSAIQAGHTLKIPVTKVASAETTTAPAAPVVPAATGPAAPSTPRVY